ncbi:MAG: FAD-dependent oxidoreductase [Planctomycetota bacterium]|nr:MAG: FAD-dependent oxidoreductase [Planctomycetota bacterium]
MNIKFNRRNFIKAIGLGTASLAIQKSKVVGEVAHNKKQPDILFQRKIPVRHEVDVFIAGGGPSGVAAALAARRQDANVFLVEGQSFFGGMGTAGLVPSFSKFSDGINFLAGGVGRQIYDRCRDTGVFGPDYNPDRKYRWDGNPIHAEGLKRVYDSLITECGADFTFQTRLVAVNVENGSVQYAFCHAKSGLFAVKAHIYVDCTGDGDLAAWAGASFQKGDEQGNVQAGTLCSIWSGVDWDKARKAGMYGKWPLGQSDKLKQAINDGIFTVKDPHLPGIWLNGRTQGGGNIGHAFGVDGTDERSITKALLQERKKLLEYQRYYKEYNPGFENIELAATGTLLGIRETRRIIGDYVLNLEDYTNCADFPDEIGRYNNEIDIHASSVDANEQQRMQKLFAKSSYKQGESYGIPYRALTPKGLENVLVAGRCISTDRYVHGSIRVMPGCMITGQAAGAAAALAAAKKTNTRAINVKDLQKNLKNLGAFLPNA